MIGRYGDVIGCDRTSIGQYRTASDKYRTAPDSTGQYRTVPDSTGQYRTPKTDISDRRTHGAVQNDRTPVGHSIGHYRTLGVHYRSAIGAIGAYRTATLSACFVELTEM